MTIYIYAADIYCAKCANKTMGTLDAAGRCPSGYPDETTYNSDVYPKGPYPNGGGEADSPQHCGGCGMFLENPLTKEGLAYVEGCLRDYVLAGQGNPECLAVWYAFYLYENGAYTFMPAPIGDIPPVEQLERAFVVTEGGRDTGTGRFKIRNCRRVGDVDLTIPELHKELCCALQEAENGRAKDDERTQEQFEEQTDGWVSSVLYVLGFEVI